MTRYLIFIFFPLFTAISCCFFFKRGVFLKIRNQIFQNEDVFKYKDKRNYNEADVLVDKKLFERQSRYLKNNSIFYQIFKLIDGKKFGWVISDLEKELTILL